MGESFDITNVEMVNGNTLVQVDFCGETSGRGRMFIELRDVLRALNNVLYTDWEKTQVDMGAVKVDESAPTFGLLN